MTLVASISTYLSENEALTQSALAGTILAFSLMVALRAGMFSFAGVGFWAIGGYTAAVIVQDGRPTLLAIAAALALSGALSFVLALVLGRLRAVYMAMATFAFVMIVRTIALSWDGVTGGAQGLFGIPNTVTTLGCAVAVLACVAVVVAIGRGRTGRALAAIRTDEALAVANGVSVVRHRVAMFVLSGMLGALSGALNALLFNTLSPDQGGFPLILDALTMVVLGGAAAWWGPLIGAFIVVWLPEILRFAGDWRSVVQGVLVVLVVVYLPGGIVSAVHAGRDRVRRGLARRRGAEPALPAQHEGVVP